MIKDWKDTAISLENLTAVLICGERLPVIFLISRWVIPKGMDGHQRHKKWRPLISSGLGSFRKMVEDFRDDRKKIGENAKIEHICIDGVTIIFRVITEDRIEHYYASGAGA